MPSLAHLALLLCLGALLPPQPGRAEEACDNGNSAAAYRLEAALPPSHGTTRPVVRLVPLQPASDPSVLVVLDGIVLLAKDDTISRQAYSRMMAGFYDHQVSFVASDSSPDRRHRRHGTISFESGDNLGERLLSAGIAVADVSFTPCAKRFLAAEDKARAEKRGIWGQRRIWTDLNAAATGLPDFVLGRGKVASIGQSGRTTYINFGGYFRTDATVRLREAMVSALVAAGVQPESLAGRVVEVRGWASQRNGLDMELSSPLALRLPRKALGTGAD